MQFFIILLLIWCLDIVSAAIQQSGMKAVESGLGPQLGSERLIDEMSSTVLKRSPGNRHRASSQSSSQRSNSYKSESSSRASSPESNQSQRGRQNMQTAPTPIPAPSSSNHQSPAARISRPVNRNTGTLRDLVRSVSPPQSRNRASSTRNRSASPPAVRKIRQEYINMARPGDRFPARATIAMTGPGIIYHLWPAGDRSITVVPPKKTVLKEVTHSQVAFMGGSVHTRGHMIAEASGARTRSTLWSQRGRGAIYMKDLFAESFSEHDPQTNVQLTSQGIAWYPKSSTVRTYAQDGAQSTALACSDPNLCFVPAWDVSVR